MADYESPAGADISGLDWQNSVIDKDLTAPPGSPSVGDRYIVATGATGAWSGHDDDIAEWTGSAWSFATPNEGWTVWVEDEDLIYVYDGAAWNQLTGTGLWKRTGTSLEPVNAGDDVHLPVSSYLRVDDQAYLTASLNVGAFLSGAEKINVFSGSSNVFWVESTGTVHTKDNIELEDDGIIYFDTAQSIFSTYDSTDDEVQFDLGGVASHGFSFRNDVYDFDFKLEIPDEPWAYWFHMAEEPYWDTDREDVSWKMNGTTLRKDYWDGATDYRTIFLEPVRMTDDNYLYLSTAEDSWIRFNSGGHIEIECPDELQVTGDSYFDSTINLLNTGTGALRFYGTGTYDKTLVYNLGSTRFDFNDDLYVTGAFNATGIVTTGDGGTTNYSQFAADGTLSMTGTARVTKLIHKYAYNQWGEAGTFNTVVCAASNASVLGDKWYFKRYHQTNDQATCMNFRLPLDYEDGTDITVNIFWTSNTTTGNVVWQCGLLSIGATESYAQAHTFDSAQTIVAPGTGWDSKEMQFSFTETGFVAGDEVAVVVFREAGNGSDTMAGAAYTSTVSLEYTSNKLGE